MSETNPQATPVDLDAASKALSGGQSLATHLGLSDQPVRLLYAVAVGHYEAGRYAQAIPCLLQAAALNARLPEVWSLLGNSMMREGKFAEALEAWLLSLHLQPSFAAALQVTRTAVALKDTTSAAVGIMAMFKHATTAEQQATSAEWSRAVQALGVEGAGAAPTAPR